MKKIMYLIFLGFVFLLINVSFVEAKSVTDICYYKTEDNNFTFAVKAYDDGTSDAILMNSYDENSFPSNYSGHKESQSYRATWKNIGNALNGSSCNRYMKYTVNSGDNRIEFSNTTPTLGVNDLLLVNYNFEGSASKCVYKGLDYKLPNYQITMTVLIDDNSIFTYYNDDLNTAMNRNIKIGGLFDADKIEYTLDGGFYNDFIEYFYDDSEGCPLIDNVQSYSDQVWISAVDDSNGSNFGLISSEYNDSVSPEEELRSYPINFDDGENKIQFYIKTYNDDKEKICLSIDNLSLKCAEMNYQDDEIFIHSGSIGGKWYVFKIKQEDIPEIFKYDVPGDYSTLINPNPVYFNKGSYDIYYLSKKNDNSTVVSSDNGEEYKHQMCILKPYLVNTPSIDYELKIYEGINPDPDLYSIYDLPCDKWGYGYSLNCKGNDCSYLINQSLTNIKYYCNDVYDNYSNNNEYIEKRINECINFNNFYLYLVEQGIVDDLGSNCGFLSYDLVKILEKILDIIKIAGPLLALGLGTLDFVKTVASGDADKEMKNTFKRFGTRLIAAALLFLVPFILAFLMDIFLGSQDGYDSDNPFCKIVDWGGQ